MKQLLKELKVEEVANGYIVIMFPQNGPYRNKEHEYVARDITEVKKIINDLLKEK